jgi:hypothetical protein
MLSVQEASQEPYTLINVIQHQVSLQHQLLVAEATLARQDQLLFRPGASLPHGVGMKLVFLTGPPVAAQAPMILGGAQQEGYVYISMNQGLALWGLPDMCRPP